MGFRYALDDGIIYTKDRLLYNTSIPQQTKEPKMSTKAVREFVLEQICEINRSLAFSECSSDIRKGQIIIAERLLFSAGIYKGFKFLIQEEVPVGQKPGMIVDGTVESTPRHIALDPNTTDSTRVRYFI